MSKRKNILLRVVCIVLVSAFAFETVSLAEPLGQGVLSPQKPIETIISDPSFFEAPLEFSTLKEIHKGNQGTLIIHIQDAHSNLSGQENLAKTLDAIMSKYGVSLILVEGSSKEATLTPIKEMAPSKEICQRVAKSFLIQGKIAGEEYLNLVSDQPMKIMGIEDRSLYIQSIENYGNLADKREAILSYLKTIQMALDKLKQKFYPEELLNYEKQGRADDKGFEANFKELFSIAQKKAIDLTEFPNIQKLIALQEKEKKIDFDAANLEQAALVEEIGQKGGKENLEEYLKKSNQLKNAKVSQFAFFQNIFNIAKEKNIDLSKYPNLIIYGNYLKEFSDIDLEQVLDELVKAEDKIYVSLLIDKDPRLIRSIDRYVKLLNTAYNIQMSTKDFNFFKANEPDFSTAVYLAFINRKLAELGYFEDLIPYENVLEEGKKALVGFYESVNKRDLAFMANTGRILSEQNQKVAVLISGGYHTSHLTKLFKDKGYSYAVLTPVVTSETNQAKYEKLLLSPVRKETRKIETIHGTSKTANKPLGELEKDLIKPKRAADGVKAFGAVMRAQQAVPEFAEAYGLPANMPTVTEAQDALTARTDNPTYETTVGEVPEPSTRGARMAAEENSKKIAISFTLLETLEDKEVSFDDRKTIATALGSVYAALVAQGKMSLSALESKLNDQDAPVRQAAATTLGPIYAALVAQGKMPLSALESKLDDPNWLVRESAIIALGPVYTSLVNQGKEVSLSKLESILNVSDDTYLPALWATSVALTLIYTALVAHGGISLSSLESKLNSPYWENNKYIDTTATFGSVYAALVAQGKEVSLFALESKLNDSDRNVRRAAIAALGPIYTTLATQGKEVSLLPLESKLNDSDSDVCSAAATTLGSVYAALVAQGKMPLSALESKLNDSNWWVRESAIIALGLVYAALVAQGKMPLSALESKLNDSKRDVRRAAIAALGPIYTTLATQGKEVSSSKLESKLNDQDGRVRQAAATTLSPVYAALVAQGKMPLSALESKLNYSDLGSVYAALVAQGKEVSLLQLESKLNDSDSDVRSAAAKALSQTLGLLIIKGQLLDSDYNKVNLWIEETLPFHIPREVLSQYFDSKDPRQFIRKVNLWNEENLPFEVIILSEYFNSKDPRQFISELKSRAKEKIEKGFDPDKSEDLFLVFVGLRSLGVNITLEQIRERTDVLRQFDSKHPGSFQQLFNKTQGLPILEVSAKESRQLDLSNVSVSILDDHLRDLTTIKEEVDSLGWVAKRFPGHKVLNLRNLYFQVKRQQAIKEGRITKESRFQVDIPADEDQIKRELLSDKKLFLETVFRLIVPKIGEREWREHYLWLLRSLIVSEVLEDTNFASQLSSPDIEKRIEYFGMLYEDYKNHLPNSAGFKINQIHGLAESLGKLAAPVFAEIGKVKTITTKAQDSYRLIPMGFPAVFRGRAGIVDCSFDIDKGKPFTRAMHEDTIYYFVYKGKELKGYIGLMMAKDVKTGRKILTIDTVNSPSLDGEELLTNLFGSLHSLANSLGADGIALPKIIGPSFNFHNEETIPDMRIYKEATPIHTEPLNKETWAYFTEAFGPDRYNSIEYNRFKLLNISGARMAIAQAPLAKQSVIDKQLAEQLSIRLYDIYGELNNDGLKEIGQLVENDFRLLGMAVASRSLKGAVDYVLGFRNGYAFISPENNTITFFRKNEDGSKGSEIGSITLTPEQVEQGDADLKKLKGKSLEQIVEKKELPGFVTAAEETQRMLRLSEGGGLVVVDAVAEDIFVTGQAEVVEMVQKAKLLLQKSGILVRLIKLNGTLDERYSALSDAIPQGAEYGQMLLASEASVKLMKVPQGSGLLLVNKEDGHIVPILPSLTTAADIKRNGKTDKGDQRLKMLSGNPLADLSSVTIGHLQQIPTDFEEKKDEYLATIYKPLSIQTLKLTAMQIIGYAQMVARYVYTSA